MGTAASGSNSAVHYVTAEFFNAEIRFVNPAAAGDRIWSTRVIAAGAGPADLVIFDPVGDYFNLMTSGGGCSPFTVLPFHEGFWGGEGLSASYSSGPDETTFGGEFGTETGTGVNGDSVRPGMTIVPNAAQNVPLEIIATNINQAGSDTVTVKGDATHLIATNQVGALTFSTPTFRIHQGWPWRYDVNTDEVRTNNPAELVSRNLWNGYRRLSITLPATVGSEAYLCWNRLYLPKIGRWTSPDPAASPWSNLFDYCSSAATMIADPSGLSWFYKDTEDWIRNTVFDVKNSKVVRIHEDGKTYSDAFEFEGGCGAWELAKAGEEMITTFIVGTDVNFCCKAYRRKCKGKLHWIEKWKEAIEVTVKVAGHSDDADLLKFTLNLGDGARTIMKKDVTMYGWKKQCKCKKENGGCREKLCREIKPPDASDDSFIMSESNDYEVVKKYTRTTSALFPDEKYLDVAVRPWELGGECAGPVGN